MGKKWPEFVKPFLCSTQTEREFRWLIYCIWKYKESVEFIALNHENQPFFSIHVCWQYKIQAQLSWG